MPQMTNTPEIFNRARRRLARSRAQKRAPGGSFVHQLMAEEIAERLTWVTREFRECLIIGTAHETVTQALDKRGCSYVIADSAGSTDKTAQEIPVVQCDEDRLPFADHSFDLIINMATLDSVNDLPGALVLMRRILRPDGLLMGGLIGADSLAVLKSVLMEADAEQVTAHIHPQIDVRTMGDLLARAGFALPVADLDQLNVRYSSLDKLIADIRDTGGGNVLAARPASSGKAFYNRARAAFAERADTDGRTSERLDIIYISAWAPHPDQPKPAARGSGTKSMKDALKTTGRTTGDISE